MLSLAAAANINWRAPAEIWEPIERELCEEYIRNVLADVNRSEPVENLARFGDGMRSIVTLATRDSRNACNRSSGRLRRPRELLYPHRSSRSERSAQESQFHYRKL